MEDLAPVAIMLIITIGVYRMLELYVRRKERLAIIEKATSENLSFDKFDKSELMGRINKAGALQIGMLLAGLGLGVLVATILFLTLTGGVDAYPQENYSRHGNFYHLKSELTLACVLLFGGLGLLAAYLIEKKEQRKYEEKRRKGIE